MRASGAGEPCWRITNGPRRVNGTGVLGRLQVVKLYSTWLQMSSLCTRCAELIELMAYGQFRAAAKAMNSSISTDCEGPRPRVAENVPGRVLRDDDRDVCLNRNMKGREPRPCKI